MMPKEQKRCCRGLKGCEDQLRISKQYYKNVRTGGKLYAWRG